MARTFVDSALALPACLHDMGATPIYVRLKSVASILIDILDTYHDSLKLALALSHSCTGNPNH